MKQAYQTYTAEDQAVWRLLYERQMKQLPLIASRAYLEGIEKVGFVADHIPNFETETNPRLRALTGWEVEVVPGLIPQKEFFELLSNRKFPASTWLRKPDQLDYLEEPDMFHDSFGHMPLLMHPLFAQFMEEFGKLGYQYRHNPNCIEQLQRLYWFSIEFGIIRSQQNKCKIYGAGIISSYGETNHIYAPNVEIVPFDLDMIIHTHFRTDQIQTRYFEIASFEQLFAAVGQLQNSYEAAKV